MCFFLQLIVVDTCGCQRLIVESCEEGNITQLHQLAMWQPGNVVIWQLWFDLAVNIKSCENAEV